MPRALAGRQLADSTHSTAKSAHIGRWSWVNSNGAWPEDEDLPAAETHNIKEPTRQFGLPEQVAVALDTMHSL